MVSFHKTITAACLVIAMMGASIRVHAQHFTKYVDPFIGTGGHGHTYPGATVPFGMVQVSPDNGDEGWDWCSGYHYEDSTIAGFSHTHLSGTGCGDWIDISVMPATHLIDDTTKFYKVHYSHKNEKATPGFYSVKLDNGIKVSLTATERCALHKYVFPARCNPVIRFELNYAINYDSATQTRIYRVNDTTIMGYRYSTGWAKVQKVYFAARTSVPFSNIYRFEDRKLTDFIDEKGQIVNCELQFDDMDGQPLLMKVALSSVSMEKAIGALDEIQGWDFDLYKAMAQDKWEKELEKIQVQTNDEQLRKIFYTALYHTCMAPVLYSDADGQYRNAKGEVMKMKTGQRYTVFSLWDTFRGLNPLFTITQTDRNTDILNSMLAFCDENGLLPVWDLSTYETNCMSGYHAVPVLADAVLKNTPGLDEGEVYKDMKKSAFQKERGTQDYIKYGYLPQDKGWYSVTLTVEYAYDDWCIAQVAKKLGKMNDYHEFMKRADSWKTLFDKQTGFIRGKNSDGKWVTPFDPYSADVDGAKAMYEEGNAWQYTFFVPQDVKGLADAFGGSAFFIQKLDSLFTVSSVIKGESAPPDVSGLIGQYAHGNEPSHHIAYLYSFVGQPWKTQEKIRMILDSMYHDQPQNGYAGNEDCGQMSAWAVWSMMGMYPANPAGGQYVFGSPSFDAVTINLPDGKQMKILAHNNSKKNVYIKEIYLDGQPYTKTYITHTDLMKGGLLEFFMSDVPNKSLGINDYDMPGYSKK